MAYTTVATAKLDRALSGCELFCDVFPLADTFAGIASGTVGQALSGLSRWWCFDRGSFAANSSVEDSAVSHQFDGNSMDRNQADQSAHRRICILPMLLIEVLADCTKRLFVSYLNRQKESTIPIRSEAYRQMSALPT